MVDVRAAATHRTVIMVLRAAKIDGSYRGRAFLTAFYHLQIRALMLLLFNCAQDHII